MNVPITDGDRVVIVAGVGNKETDYDQADVRQLTLLMSGLWRILQRRQADSALRESEGRFRSIMEQSTFSMMILSPDGKVLDANDANLRLWGVDREHAKSYNILADLQLERLGLMPLVLRAMAGEQVSIPAVSYDLSSTLGKGACKIVQGDLYPLRDANGTIRHIILIHQDITERKRNEAEREKLQIQLTQAQKMESVGRLAGGVAHDFNNMLQAILGNTSMALTDLPPSSPAKECLVEIQRCAQRSADLTRQLLAFARQQTIAPKVLDLNDTVAGMLKMLRRLIGEDIDLAWRPATNLRNIHMDPSQVDQILANLCVNARDAIGNRVGKVTIETANVVIDESFAAMHPEARTGDFVRLAVSDDGSGMSPEVRAHLFEPFFTTKGLGKGTGLGLATVYGIVKQNNGFINVYSEPNWGSSFQIHLPPHAAAEAPAPAPLPPHPLNRGNETLLLVEDEPSILRINQRLLAKLGYHVLAAQAPGEAIQIAHQHKGEIHLLMTDVVMPEMNGRELAQKLMDQFPNIKCLFMSGYTADVIAHHGVLEQGMHFLQKPFSIDDLSEKIREALGNRRENTP